MTQQLSLGVEGIHADGDFLRFSHFALLNPAIEPQQHVLQRLSRALDRVSVSVSVLTSTVNKSDLILSFAELDGQRRLSILGDTHALC